MGKPICHKGTGTDEIVIQIDQDHPTRPPSRCVVAGKRAAQVRFPILDLNSMDQCAGVIDDSSQDCLVRRPLDRAGHIDRGHSVSEQDELCGVLRPGQRHNCFRQRGPAGEQILYLAEVRCGSHDRAFRAGS